MMGKGRIYIYSVLVIAIAELQYHQRREVRYRGVLNVRLNAIGFGSPVRLKCDYWIVGHGRILDGVRILDS